MRAVQRHHPFPRMFLIVALPVSAVTLQSCRDMPNNPKPGRIHPHKQEYVSG